MIFQLIGHKSRQVTLHREPPGNTEVLKKPEKVEMRKPKQLSNEFWILMNLTDGQMFIWDSP